MKGYRSQKPEPFGAECGEDPRCYSKHLPLCGRPSRPIVVQKLVVLPLAPLRLRRHAADPLVVSGSDMRSGRCVAPATITTGCGPLPPLPEHSIIVFSPSRTPCCLKEHSQANIPVVFSLFLLYSCSPLVFMLIVLRSTLIIHTVIF